jgi:Fe-Mn family superoxide dismutase
MEFINNQIQLNVKISEKLKSELDHALSKKQGFKVDFEFKKLPYGTNALSFVIDEETMKLHHDKHHKKYFDNLMEALEGEDLKDKCVNDILENINNLPKDKREKVKNNGGGHFNHEFFWNLMSPKPKSTPTGKLANLIDKQYGSYTNFVKEFKQAGIDHFGSGWVWLCINNGKLAINSMLNQNNPIIEGCGIPLVGCDIWEHAYYLNYKNDRAAYLDKWFSVLNWEFPEKILGEL